MQWRVLLYESKPDCPDRSPVILFGNECERHADGTSAHSIATPGCYLYRSVSYRGGQPRKLLHCVTLQASLILQIWRSFCCLLLFTVALPARPQDEEKGWGGRRNLTVINHPLFPCLQSALHTVTSVTYETFFIAQKPVVHLNSQLKFAYRIAMSAARLGTYLAFPTVNNTFLTTYSIQHPIRVSLFPNFPYFE